jgi:hypothetical protein
MNPMIRVHDLATNQIIDREMTNDELEELMYKLDIGDDTDKPYYGHNFIIRNSDDEIDNS